ncbi:hypothetical protein ACH4OY_29910 [Micromonospora rubida]|uniref:Nucleoside diphosphate kinase-like domain-containing protein n=1 Tax=Micromonospora rubida TaxID=2697657 RepID=A0ABW7SUW2_9ACTN
MTRVPHDDVEDDLRALSADTEKLELYRRDDSLPTGITAAKDALGLDFARELQRIALVVIHPDLIAQRRVERCLTFARDHDLQPVVALPFVFEPAMTAAMWQHSLDDATEDSLAVCDVFCAKTESLLVLLRDRGPEPTRAASARLSALKGSTRAERRQEGHLRSHLRATNQIVTAVHCSDEPIDILRELAILVPETMAHLLMTAVRFPDDGASPDLDRQIAGLYARTPPYDIDVARAVARIRAKLADCAGDPRVTAAHSRLSGNLEAWQRGERFLRWQEFTADLGAIGIAPDSWDAILVGSTYVQHERTVSPG